MRFWARRAECPDIAAGERGGLIGAGPRLTEVGVRGRLHSGRVGGVSERSGKVDNASVTRIVVDEASGYTNGAGVLLPVNGAEPSAPPAADAVDGPRMRSTVTDVNALCNNHGTTRNEEQVKRLGLIAVLATMLVGVSASAALGVTNFANAPSGAHYATGSAEPVCTLTGLTVSCTGTTIGGVGNTNATVTLAVTSTFTGTCTNRGGHLVEPFTEQETTTTSTVVTSTRNGQLIVPAQTATGVSSEQFLASFECPNPNWTPAVTGTAISYRYSLTFAGFTEPAITVTG